MTPDNLNDLEKCLNLGKDIVRSPIIQEIYLRLIYRAI
jgi:hypothetical protein